MYQPYYGSVSQVYVFNIPSAPSGLSKIAQNEPYQYGHVGLVTAMRIGAAAHMTDGTRTSQYAETLCKTILRRGMLMTPIKMLGMKRMEAWRAGKDWTCCILVTALMW